MIEEGLSILIPCFRYDPAPLAKALLAQLQDIKNLNWEIVIGNDHSGAAWEDTFVNVSKLHNSIHVFEPEKNLGRAAIRNRMAKSAHFNSLLFIDADSLPGSDHYIKTYLDMAGAADVVIGGTAYKPYPGCKDSLRYLYGIAREVTSALERNKQPFNRIALNNVLAKKEIWDEIPLNEAIIGYGHEDTYWGLALEWGTKTILHIDNPVFHTGLEYNETFVAKCKESAANLAQLVEIGLIPADKTKLSAAGEKLLKNKALKAIVLSMRLARPKLSEVAVQAGRFSLKALDLLKLDAYVAARLSSNTKPLEIKTTAART